MRAILSLSLFVALILLLVLTSGKSLEASWWNNLTGRDLAAWAVHAEGVCTGPFPPRVANRLERAIELVPTSSGPWRSIIRVKGLTERHWVVDRLASDVWAPPEALALLYPMKEPSTSTWNTERCLETWGTWTIALVEASSGRWQDAVALYQAGMTIAPGRVPSAIVQEYYLALARYLTTSGPEQADQQLMAAKYLALGGARKEAGERLAALQAEPRLAALQRCQASGGLAWLQSSDASDAPPPWPVDPHGDPCDSQLPAVASPNWIVTEGSPVIDEGSGAELIGFDLDQDVLEAGAEVIGVLYWRTTDGHVTGQPFRQPNLWVNSSNNWLAWPGLTQCIPGYTEPAWVTLCAGQVAETSDDPSIRNPVAMLYNAPGDRPDAYIETLSLPLAAGSRIVYGGRWRNEGQFPRAHVSRSSSGGRYESVLNLSSLQPGHWQQKASVAAPVEMDDDYSFWIRPRVGVGEGTLWFDDVFSFELPAYAH